MSIILLFLKIEVKMRGIDLSSHMYFTAWSQGVSNIECPIWHLSEWQIHDTLPQQHYLFRIIQLNIIISPAM